MSASSSDCGLESRKTPSLELLEVPLVPTPVGHPVLTCTDCDPTASLWDPPWLSSGSQLGGVLSPAVLSSSSSKSRSNRFSLVVAHLVDLSVSPGLGGVPLTSSSERVSAMIATMSLAWIFFSSAFTLKPIHSSWHSPCIPRHGFQLSDLGLISCRFTGWIPGEAAQQLFTLGTKRDCSGSGGHVCTQPGCC